MNSRHRTVERTSPTCLTGRESSYTLSLPKSLALIVNLLWTSSIVLVPLRPLKCAAPTRIQNLSVELAA
jgi:hypothetical protein